MVLAYLHPDLTIHFHCIAIRPCYSTYEQLIGESDRRMLHALWTFGVAGSKSSAKETAAAFGNWKAIRDPCRLGGTFGGGLGLTSISEIKYINSINT